MVSLEVGKALGIAVDGLIGIAKLARLVATAVLQPNALVVAFAELSVISGYDLFLVGPVHL